MKVLIVEDALSSLNGHWFQYISDIVRDGGLVGYNIHVAVPKDASKEVLAGLPCHPILSSSLSKRKTAQTSFLTSLWRIFSSNRSLYQDLKNILLKENTYDLIISPSTRVDHLIAYLLLFLRLKNKSKTRFVLIFIDAVASYSSDYSKIHFSKKSLILKIALKLTRGHSSPRELIFAAESLGMARQYKLLSGVDFKVVPHVTVLPTLDTYRSNLSSQHSEMKVPLVLATYGFTRFDKGLDILQDALKSDPELLQNPNVLFVLQWTGDYVLPDGKLIQKEPILENAFNVSYIPAFEGSEQYYQWIAKTNIIVLPYRRAFYCDRLSRVAIDAAIAGIPVVYPRGTWLESFVSEYGSGIPFDAENLASLAEAIIRAISQFNELKEKASINSHIVSNAFSAAAFFRTITKL